MSEQQKEIILIPRGVIWYCHIVATQPVGAPNPMGFYMDIPDGERGLFLGGQVGLDNYGAARQIDVDVRIAGFSSSYYTLGSDSIDNLPIPLAPIYTNSTGTSTTQDVMGVPYMPFLLTENNTILFFGASLANTETLTGRFYIATRVLPPTANAFGSGVTLTTETIIQV